ncbi:MAG: hypothetical protein DLM52_05565 [Chthoniobacterales bacterium]|nr:MAG: hypothetical protein DLM52_05565 [Chthoniobacterales bacterium]
MTNRAALLNLGAAGLTITPAQTTNTNQMKKSILLLASVAISGVFAGLSSAQSEAPYTEGTVWNITMVKTKPGMSDDYLKGLTKTFKGTLDEAKKQSLVMNYKVLLGDSATPGDFDVLLMVEYKNMAAFDNLREKTDPIFNKLMGSEDQQRQTAVKRMEIRDILGDKVMREITLK